MLQPRRAFGQVTLEPPHRRLLALRRPALGVHVDELERVLERQIREFASSVLSQPESSALDGTTEADVRVRLRGQERMFARLSLVFPTADDL